LELSVGDRFIILDSQGLRREVLVEGIAENYVGHSLYLTPTSYEKIFKEIPEENALYMTLNETEGEAKRELKDAILDQEAAYAIVDIATNKDDVSDMLQSLNTVVLVIILASSLLVVIVLYNLTNINISERIREISTIKVLGFYPKEVTAYIYRETYLLTLLGILIGFAGGRVLHLMIIRIFAPAQILMIQSMHWSRLLLAGGITLFFSIVVMFLMHRKMDRIVMIDALKSVE
jgi:putative ABC transport system permease protein